MYCGVDSPVVNFNISSLGFYTVSALFPSSPNQKEPYLILGPLASRPAHQTIALGKGVRGTAASQKRTVRVRDLHQFEGHVACDGDIKSEIVAPILDGQEVGGLLSAHIW